MCIRDSRRTGLAIAEHGGAIRRQRRRRRGGSRDIRRCDRDRRRDIARRVRLGGGQRLAIGLGGGERHAIAAVRRDDRGGQQAAIGSTDFNRGAGFAGTRNAGAIRTDGKRRRRRGDEIGRRRAGRGGDIAGGVGLGNRQRPSIGCLLYTSPSPRD